MNSETIKGTGIPYHKKKIVPLILILISTLNTFDEPVAFHGCCDAQASGCHLQNGEERFSDKQIIMKNNF